jgi:putative membrane protein
MIRNFSDHSANERTFLAWVRTAIAVMAFGFLVEKFDLFLEVAAPSLAGRTLSLPGQKFGNLAGLALIVLGTAMVGIAAVRFVRTAKNIDQKELRPGTGSRIDIALAGLLVQTPMCCPSCASCAKAGIRLVAFSDAAGVLHLIGTALMPYDSS